jgi:hypothetical protein
MTQPKPDRITLQAPQTVPRKFALKLTAHTVFGILFLVTGVIALIHGNFTLPGKKQTITIQGQHVVMETHRVISIPRPASATEVVLGIGLIIVGSLPGARYRR